MTVANGAKLSKQLQKTIHLDVVSYIDDKRYFGDFVVKKLTIRDLAALGVRKAQLNGGMHCTDTGQGVSPDTDEINGQIAHLEIALVQAPTWWKLDEIVDWDIVAALYREVVSFENSFLKRKLEAQQRATAIARGEAGSEGAAAKPYTPGVDRAVVDADVQASLEP